MHNLAGKRWDRQAQPRGPTEFLNQHEKVALRNFVAISDANCPTLEDLGTWMEDPRLETLMNSRVLAVRCGVGRAWRELAQMDVTRGRKTIRTIAASVDCKLRAVEEIEQARYEMGVAGTLRRFFEMVGQQASDIPDSGRTTMDEVMMTVGRGGKKVVMINDVQPFRKKLYPL